MKIEIPDSQIEAEFHSLMQIAISKALKEYVNDWTFNEQIRKIVKPIVDEQIAIIAKEQAADMQSIKDDVRKMVMKRLQNKIMKEVLSDPLLL